MADPVRYDAEPAAVSGFPLTPSPLTGDVTIDANGDLVTPNPRMLAVFTGIQQCPYPDPPGCFLLIGSFHAMWRPGTFDFDKSLCLCYSTSTIVNVGVSCAWSAPFVGPILDVYQVTLCTGTPVETITNWVAYAFRDGSGGWNVGISSADFLGGGNIFFGNVASVSCFDDFGVSNGIICGVPAAPNAATGGMAALSFVRCVKPAPAPPGGGFSSGFDEGFG